MKHRLYADENFPLPVDEELRRLGHDVLTMYEDDKANQSLPDDEVLTLASEKQRALLTTNRRHFIQLQRRTSERGGIIVCTFDPDFKGRREESRRRQRTRRASQVNLFASTARPKQVGARVS